MLTQPRFTLGFDLDTVKMLMNIFVSRHCHDDDHAKYLYLGHGSEWDYRVSRCVVL